MKYMGSKARHAKEILPIILAGRNEGQAYVEPFVGGANVIDKVDGRRIGADCHAGTIALWQSVAEGWMPPRYVSESLYAECSASKETPAPIVGYVGFALSYGGKWFGGYRRDKTGSRDYADESFRSAEKQFPLLRGVDFRLCSYDQLAIPLNSIIYCDPPYEGTTKYATGGFDHKAFWQWCGDMHDLGHKVFVSEYAAPDGWQCVWQKSVHNTLVKDTGAKTGVEKLFTPST